jgi:hypothetical protein
LGKFFKSLSLARFGSLSIRDVEKRKPRNIAMSKGCGYARIHAPGHETNSQLRLVIRSGWDMVSGIVLSTH